LNSIKPLNFNFHPFLSILPHASTPFHSLGIPEK
jgi:hypothetical protein